MSFDVVDANHLYVFKYKPTHDKEVSIRVEYDPTTEKVIDVKNKIAKQLGIKADRVNMFGGAKFYDRLRDDDFFKVSAPFRPWISILEKKEEKKA